MHFPRHLHGEFAVVLQDGEQTLLTRDAVGTLPLYYRVDAGSVRFSSQIGDFADTGSELDEEYIARVLVGILRDQHLTPYRGVHKVPPGHLVRLSPGEPPRLYEWWQPPDTDQDLAALPDAELAGQLRERVLEAVQWACPAGTHAASELTGGLDSSSVTSVAAWLAAGQAESTAFSTFTFSIDPHAAHITRERPFIDAVIDRYGLNHVLTGLEPLGDDDVAVAPPGVMPHPTRLPSCRLQHLGAASRNGVDVLLSGWGGDQLSTFKGAGLLAGLVRRGRILSAYRAGSQAAAYTDRSRRALLRSTYSAHLRQPRAAATSIAQVAAMADPGLVRRTGMSEFSAPPIAHDADAERWRWYSDGHVQRRIECYVWDTSGLPLAYRYPLLDQRLVEWVLSVPAARWVVKGQDRSLFRQAMSGLVPDEVLHRARKNEPDPDRRTVVRETIEYQDAEIAELMNDPQVRHYLPGLSVEDYRRLDRPRRTHVLLTARFLKCRVWEPEPAPV